MNEKSPNLFHVTCAIIERDGLVLAAQRSHSMRMPLKWEFPGGMIEPGEEMEVRLTVKRVMPTMRHVYPDFTLTLHPFVYELLSGEVILNEQRAIAWLKPEELPILSRTTPQRGVGLETELSPWYPACARTRRRGWCGRSNFRR